MTSRTEAHRARRNVTQHPSARVGCLLVWSLLAAGAVSALHSAEKKSQTAGVTAPPAQASTEPRTDIEAHFFTAPGFSQPGRPVTAAPAGNGKLRLIVRDASTGRPTPCRINVVGADGNFYQPPESDRLAGWSLAIRANRRDTGPYRYLGYFFYSSGETTLDVPPGTVRIEVWKGLEFSPIVGSATMEAGRTREVTMNLRRAASLADLGYYSADLHMHVPRQNDADDALAFDLMEGEDVSYATSLASNRTGAYAGILETLVGGTPPSRWPQMQGFGPGSVRERGGRQLMTAQEYRSGNFGHLNLYWRDTVVLSGASYNTNSWPVYGFVGRQTQNQGGFAFYAHGGYDRGIYADVAMGAVDAVEVLQFGAYRGVALRDWYNILNSGYRLPGLGASDYPACRRFADCITYVRPLSPAGKSGPPSMKEVLQAAATGRSFVTSGPLLLLDVNGETPGAQLSVERNARLAAKIRVRSEVAPITHVDLIVDGRTVMRFRVPAEQGRGRWHEFEHAFNPTASCWIAARAWSHADFGIKLPYDELYADSAAEAHTNPVYCYIDGKAPYSRLAIDAWISRIDVRLDAHRRVDARSDFPAREQVVAYYERARDVLVRIRSQGGLSAQTNIRDFAGELPAPTPGTSGGNTGAMPGRNN